MGVKFKKDYVVVTEKKEIDAEFQEQLDRDKISDDKFNAEQQAYQNRKASAKAKLAALDFTEEEADIILG